MLNYSLKATALYDSMLIGLKYHTKISIFKFQLLNIGLIMYIYTNNTHIYIYIHMGFLKILPFLS